MTKMLSTCFDRVPKVLNGLHKCTNCVKLDRQLNTNSKLDVIYLLLNNYVVLKKLNFL